MHLDWQSIFVPQSSLLELVLRGTVMYLVLFALLRIVLRRQAGTLGVSDLLLITLLADAAQNGLAGDYKTLPEGIVLVSTILFWNYALDWLSYKSATIRRLVEPPPVLLIKDGKLMRRNMRHELITEDEVMMELREQGIEDVAEVKKAWIESDGRISMIQQDGKRHEKQKRNNG